MCNADNDPVKKIHRYAESETGCGLITFPTDGNIDLYRQMVKEKFPLVFIDRLVKGISVDIFLLDNENAVELAVDHFVEKGHQSIGMITTSLLRNVTPRIKRIKFLKIR